MRLTTLLLVTALIGASSAAYGQITLKEKNAPLEKVLSDIERQTKFVFLYDPDEVKIGPITVGVINASLQETLEACFKGQPVEFTIVGNNVLLKRKQAGDDQRITEINIRGRVVDENGSPLG